MRLTKTILTAVALTFVTSAAHATCGGYWDVGVDYDKRDYNKFSIVLQAHI